MDMFTSASQPEVVQPGYDVAIETFLPCWTCIDLVNIYDVNVEMETLELHLYVLAGEPCHTN